MKKDILKTYEFVPEAYRQKFRRCAKRDDQTRVEFAGEEELLLEKLLTSKEVTKKYW